MSDRETHDFMSVDSFSQLPFMRRDHKPPNPPIRLFGFDFPPEPSATASDTNKRRSSSPSAADLADAGETVRRFECNYCFRNFPTSQALGGHQNAHKRERQHAKRANLAAASAEGHLQSMLGYHGMPASPQLHYPSWSFSAGSGGVGVRFYGGLGSVTQPINGNPMSGPWQALPAATHHHHLHDHHRHLDHFLTVVPPPLPPSSFALLRGEQERRTASTTTARERHDREPKDAVSLDLHL